MTPLKAAKIAVERFGFITIGVPPSELLRIGKGFLFFDMAGNRLRGKYLEVTGRATREQWDRQAALWFGGTGDSLHPPALGERFYKTRLVRHTNGLYLVDHPVAQRAPTRQGRP